MNECNELLWFKCNIDVIFFPFFSVAFIFCKQTRAIYIERESEQKWNRIWLSFQFNGKGYGKR